jgi:peptidoglycan/xylan/chitin deacetylase (PgdA/CDA1 family)
LQSAAYGIGAFFNSHFYLWSTEAEFDMIRRFNAIKISSALALALSLAAILMGCDRAATANAVKEREDAAAERILEALPEAKEPARVIERTDADEKEVSLIFEGFADEATMLALADIVRETGAETVFFLPGRDVSENPGVAKYMADAGIAIGNYGLIGEKGMDRNDAETNARRLFKAQRIIRAASGTSPSLLRCNGAAYTEEILKPAKLCGLAAAVEPSSYVNHRSFKDFGAARAFVKKLDRGAIISFKIGQELDEREYGTPAKADVRPAVDPAPTIENAETPFVADETEGDKAPDAAKWLIEALNAEGFAIVSLNASSKK